MSEFILDRDPSDNMEETIIVPIQNQDQPLPQIHSGLTNDSGLEESHRSQENFKQIVKNVSFWSSFELACRC